MTCWNGWRARISENFKRRSSPSSSRPNFPGVDPKLDGEIIFIQSCRPEEEGQSSSGRDTVLDNRQNLKVIRTHGIDRIVTNFSLILGLLRIKGQVRVRPSESDKGLEVRSRGQVKFRRKMEHSELVKELSHIEKLTNQERLKLAHSRRKLQLKNWNQYEKVLNNSSSISSGNKKLVLGKNNQQQQRILEQLQLQEQLRKARVKSKPNVRFCNSIMLLEAAGRNDMTEVRRLLQNGVDPDVANEDGLTALHQCCIDDNEEMMKFLIESGANVNSEDSEKWTPLHAGATCGHLHLVKHLIAKGANLLAVNAEGNMPYDICDEEATLDYIESEMAKRGVTQELIEEIRALPETRMLEDMQKLEREADDLEARDKDGATYLHIAAANGYSRVVEFLLDHHVATDVQDKDCWQPVHAAACWSHVEVLELLVGAGADLNARTKNNETPYAICEDLEIKERIIQLRSEQETKMKESGVKKLRRSVSSNSRTQSIRRTSQRDKQNATKRDAADEASMLLAIATAAKDSSPSPTGDNLAITDVLETAQTSFTSSEDEHETRSLPPWAQGRDSVTELHLGVDTLQGIRKSQVISIENDTTSTTTDDFLRLNNSARKSNKGLKNINQGNIDLTAKALRERNELNRSLQETGGTKFTNSISLPVSNPTLVLTDTNANLPNPEITPLMDLQPKSAGNAIPPNSSNTGTIRICDSNESSTVDLSGTNANSTIDIRVQVTINTNGSCGGSLNSLTPNANGGGGGTYPSSPRPTPVVQVNGPLFTPPGTLSDLKKQRSLQYSSIGRNSTVIPSNGFKDFPAKHEAPPSPSMSLKKFTGEAVGMIGEDGDGGRKCCVIV